MKKAKIDLSIEFPKDQWAFVHRFGHTSFAMLRKCFELEREFDRLTERAEISYKDFSSLPELQRISMDFFDCFYLAIISYQTSMEAIIEMCLDEDDELNVKITGNDFLISWDKALDIKELEKTDFDNYVTYVYRKYRKPLAHPTKENLILKPFNDINLEEVLQGFEYGWKAFAAISATNGKPHDVDSWKRICHMHNLPH